MLHAHIDILITIQGEAHYQEVEDGTQQYRDDRPLSLGNIALQSGIAVEQPENQEGEEPEEGQHDHLGETDYHQHGVFGLTGEVLEELGIILFVRSIIGFIKPFTQFSQAVLPTQVHLGLFPIIAGIGHDVEEWRLPLHEDIAFQRPVATLGIVVGLLQAQVGLLVMRAVGYHRSPVVGVHLQDLRGIEDTGVAQRLADRVQDEGGRERILKGNPDHLSFQR